MCQPPSWRAVLPWPLAAIDFEASSLDQDSYPIEVGLALWPAPDEPILGWSALIRPAGAKVHDIKSSDLLARGHDPARVASALNEALGPDGVAWCDGGPYDAHWARVLFEAGGVKPAFALGDWNRLASALGVKARVHTLAWLKRAPSSFCSRSPRPWSKLKSRIEALFAPGLPLAIHCNVFVKVTKKFTFDEPRYGVMLGRGHAGRIIWEFPGSWRSDRNGTLQ